MKKLILSAFLFIMIAPLWAQQPFKEYGYKVKVATLSKGKYNEFFDQDTLAQIGSVVINRLTGKIVMFVSYDTVYSEATLNPELISRWLSPDPLSSQFSNWSPYNFSKDNPIRFSDPTGLAPNDVVITGSEQQKAFTELQASVQGKLNLSMDAKGKVTYTQVAGAKLDKDSKQLTTAVDDHSVTVNVTATNNNTDSKGRLVVGGAFEGNTVTKNADGSTSVNANQEINPNVLGAADSYYGNPGANTLHEVTEAYQGAKISQASGVSSGDASAAGSVYPAAHNAATSQSGAIYETAFDGKGNKLPAGVYTGAVRAEYSVQKGMKAPVVIMKFP